MTRTSGTTVSIDRSSISTTFRAILTLTTGLVEIVGNIAASLTVLAQKISPRGRFTESPLLETVRRELEEVRARGAAETGRPIHPLRIISDLQPFLGDDVTLALDMGSFHIWHARYLYSFRPRQMLISNG